MWIFWVLTLLMVACIESDSSGHIITCDIPSVVEGQDARLTCNFGEDIRESQKMFKVERQTNNTEETILLCHWGTTTPECYERLGYTIDGDVTDTLTVIVHKTSKAHIGNFTCCLLPRETESITPCTFKLNENTITSSTSTSVTEMTTKVFPQHTKFPTSNAPPLTPGATDTTLVDEFFSKRTAVIGSFGVAVLSILAGIIVRVCIKPKKNVKKRV